MTPASKPAPSPEPPEPLDVVETSTSPSSGLALSRFEFETGKGNEGTKILMVEWDASVREQGGPAESEDHSSDWEVSWEGKTAVLPVRDSDPDANGSIRRMYFLLPPGAPIPALVSIVRKARGGGGGGTEGVSASMVLRTKPMPAIFPAELTGKQDAGRCGVLHTIWAKKRLAELQDEIAAEMRTNGESVGLEMALQERQWIVDHFGLAQGQPGVPKPTKLHIPQSPASPTSPRSPIGGRLGEKLKGLKLATSPAELAAASQAAKSAHASRTQNLATSLSTADSVPIVSSSPSIGSRKLQPTSGGGGVASLNAIMSSGLAPAAAVDAGGDHTTEEDLFVLPMSPRSPEMKRSPFSIL
ncbi:hypothetical protein VTK56DRAFT_10256 [Thermocarpiscus australiensis]